MKKAINKQERAKLLQNLVVHSAKAGGASMVETLRGIHRELADIYRQQFQVLVPELSFARQKELIQEGVLRRLNHQPRVKTSKEGNGVPFGLLTWKPLLPKAESEIFYQGLLFETMCNSWGITGVLHTNTSNRCVRELELNHNFPDVPSATFDTTLQEVDFPDRIMTLNTHNTLIGLHKAALRILEALKDLLDQSYLTYLELEAALAPIKTPKQLYELMPESMPHWPETLKYAPPTKELADPHAINEIRAKLKKGLPI